MTVKQKILTFVIVIIAIISYGAVKEHYQEERVNKSTEAIKAWLNDFSGQMIEIIKEYHRKTSEIKYVAIESDNDYFNINKMKSLKESLEQTLKVELWKIDKIIELSKTTNYNVEIKLENHISKEQIKALKNYINENINEAEKFRQLTIDYTNNQISFINFLLDRNCKLSTNDETMYNNLANKVENSAKQYNNKINEINKNKFSRVKELNKQLKISNVEKFLDILSDEVINETK